MSSIRNTLILTASLLATNTASSLECLGSYEAQLDKEQLPIPYFLNTPLTKVYIAPTGEKTRPLEKAYPLGKLLFAVDAPEKQTPEQTRLWMGKYDEMEECFTRLMWIDKKHLLSKRALKISEAVKRFPEIAQVTPETPVSPQQLSERNHLALRVLTRPEMQETEGYYPVLALGSEKRAELDLTGLSFWRYVYAIKKLADNQTCPLWFLVGRYSQLSFAAQLGTDNQDGEHTLLGWVCAQTVSIWPASVALEVNSEKEAVLERLNYLEQAPGQYVPRTQGQKRPAYVYSKPIIKAYFSDEQQWAVAQKFYQGEKLSPEEQLILDESGLIISEENQSLWTIALKGDHATEAEKEKAKAWFAPQGLHPSLPRYYVKGYLPHDPTEPMDDWYEVASLGSHDQAGKPLTAEQLQEILEKLQAMTNRLRAVDLVFVLEKSGSMLDEKEAVRDFIYELAKNILAQQGQARVSLPGLGKSIDIQLDIRLHLVIYGHRHFEYFHDYQLPNQMEEIYRSMGDDLSAIWSCGIEKTVNALTAVLRNPRYFRAGSQRGIILFTDERGDFTRGQEQAEKKALKDALYQALEPIRQTLINEFNVPKATVSQIDPKDYTPIWTFFTNSPLSYDQRQASVQEQQAFRRQELALFKQNMSITDGQGQPFSLVNEEYLYHLDFDDKDKAQIKAQTAEIRRQLGETLFHFQTQTDARIRQFMKTLADAARSANSEPAEKQTKTQLAADDPNLLHAATIEIIAKAIELEPKLIARLAFYTGYVPKRDPRHHHDTYQQVLLIEERELRAFNNQLKDIVQLIKVPAGCSQRGAVAVALLKVIATITNDQRYLKVLRRFANNPRRFCQQALQVMRGLGESTLAELLKLSSNLPLDKQGLLAKTPHQILAPGRIILLRLNNKMQAKSQCIDCLINNKMQAKSQCIDLVLAGRDVPSNVANCKHYKGKRKEWLYRPVGAESQAYIYLPTRLMP
jgi:hypothetical protein